MLRALLCFVAVAVLALPCRADPPTAPPETLIRLSVMPAPAPNRSLRHRLNSELVKLAFTFELLNSVIDHLGASSKIFVGELWDRQLSKLMI